MEEAGRRNFTVREWKTTRGHSNLLANWDGRIQFEFEERRHWYAMRIRRKSDGDAGVWRCRMIAKSKADGNTRLFESRARLFDDELEAGDSITYSVFQKRDAENARSSHVDNTVMHVQSPLTCI
ncbi:hypothetical protein M3Y99_01605400 [Aphelenchoides fujianensis]|nr:hypothetical protein M3Y99_01605400 [Aphelenchoides fujianensis]